MAQRHGTREQTAARKERIRELAAKGLHPQVIAERLGVSRRVVDSALKEGM